MHNISFEEARENLRLSRQIINEVSISRNKWLEL